MRIRGAELIDFPEMKDSRGSLCVCEVGRHIPFTIKRAFWVFGTPAGTVRGKHAHQKSTQVHVCLSGSVKISLDDGTYREEVTLDNPRQGLLIGPMVWHPFSLAANSLLFVFTSDLYDPTDYIRSFEEFVKLARGPQK